MGALFPLSLKQTPTQHKYLRFLSFDLDLHNYYYDYDYDYTTHALPLRWNFATTWILPPSCR